MHDLSGTTALVTGASRGFGRAIALALAEAGAKVVGVARDGARLEELRARLGDAFVAHAADAADPVVAGQLLDAYRPRVLVLNAGASPLLRPIHHHTWETFSRHWEVDTKHVFGWTREALLRPLAPGSVVVAMSSAAAVRGALVVGGYAGAKAAIHFIAAYAAAESERAGLGIRFRSVLPVLTPATELGAASVAGFAAHEGVEVATVLERLGPPLAPEQVGRAVVELVCDAGHDRDAYLLTAAGLSPLG
jgi:NAD(P)-dependent dehydrogenase (short-subunit alcohol dehydrogenase family)